MSPELALVALSSLPDIGPLAVRRLLQCFGSPEAVFAAPLRELMKVEGIGLKRAQRIKGFSRWQALQQGLRELAQKGVRTVSLESPEYPAMLRHLPDAPVVLYIRGRVLQADARALAIVGTRTPTPYGLSLAERIAGELARAGFTIISGLARGVDSAAHRGALKAGGRSIGVLGSGIDVPYPRENRPLMESLSRSGAVISEFPPGTAPERKNFPRRNRLISGLSMGVLVVEATQDSGSLITAQYALEQGKEVFSVPGNVDSGFSRGTNELIKQGARLITSSRDILQELAPQLGEPPGSPGQEAPRGPALSPQQARLCELLSQGPRHVDELARALGMEAQSLLRMLLELELQGLVRQAPGKRFYLC